MTEHARHVPDPGDGVAQSDEERVVRFTDKRRIDPETGEVRAHPLPDDVAAQPGGPLAGATPPASSGEVEILAEALTAAEAVAAEHLADLQRLQAEYVNYRKRVDRDRSVSAELAVLGLVEALLPVLDDVELARQHGELEGGPFASIAEKLETTLARFGWERYGAVGEVFDPTVHEALMHAESPDVTEPVVTRVLQPGHKLGERIVRAARVAVTAPE